MAGTAALVRDLVAAGSVSGAHDVAEGGVARRPRRDGRSAAGSASSAARLHTLADLFGESPGRVVLCVAPEAPRRASWRRHEAAGVGGVRLGLATGDRLHVKDLLDVALAELTAAWRDRLPAALGHGTTQG